MGPVLKRENLMSWNSVKSLPTKNKLLVPHFLAHQAVLPDIGWFNGMYFPKHVRL